jgi:hypothetical protein
VRERNPSSLLGICNPFDPFLFFFLILPSWLILYIILVFTLIIIKGISPSCPRRDPIVLIFHIIVLT